MKSFNEILEELGSVGIGVASTPSVYRRILTDSNLPLQLRELMASGALPESVVREYVEQLMEAFQKGTQFEYEPFLATIAIACESLFSDFADEFLIELAALRLAELPMAPRIARRILETRTVSSKSEFVLLENVEYCEASIFSFENPAIYDTSETVAHSHELAYVA